MDERAGMLQAAPHRKFRIRTTDSPHDQPIALNRLSRQFHQPLANRAWVSDISYVLTQEGWLFVSVMLDLFSRRVMWLVDGRLSGGGDW